MQSEFDRDYYENGIETGKSNYFQYQWMPELTTALAKRVIQVLDIPRGDFVFDFGCAKGFFVKAMRSLQMNCYGYDISEYAIQNCHPDVKGFVSNDLSEPRVSYYQICWDYLYSKDVLEHIEEEELRKILPDLLKRTCKKALIVVPLSVTVGGGYCNPLDEQDSTHVIRWPMQNWLQFLESQCQPQQSGGDKPQSTEFIFSGSYRIPGIKASSEVYPGSTGFILAQRL